MKHAQFEKITKAGIGGFLLSVVILINGYSQHPGKVNFRHLTLKDGLSQSTGNDILQDYKGYIWIGTQDGLNKYNGHEITVYKNINSESTSIGSSQIAAIFEDSRNNLWIATNGGGLNWYNRKGD